MKTEFKAKPVYLSLDERIKAHFTTCYLALVIFRKKLDYQYKSTHFFENSKSPVSLNL